MRIRGSPKRRLPGGEPVVSCVCVFAGSTGKFHRVRLGCGTEHSSLAEGRVGVLWTGGWSRIIHGTTPAENTRIGGIGPEGAGPYATYGYMGVDTIVKERYPGAAGLSLDYGPAGAGGMARPQGQRPRGLSRGKSGSVVRGNEKARGGDRRPNLTRRGWGPW